ncbi:MAG: O-antigen ligase family protein [Oscillibacter sp.]|nr:O-antigen ligase family protein [Oscillibacter sp.]
MTRKPRSSSLAWSGFQQLDIVLGAAMFFLAVCLSSAATVKAAAMLLVPLTLSAAFLFYDRLRDRLNPPVLALGLVVLMDGVSALYAISGKFALNELLKVVAAFCMALLLLAFIGKEKPERKAASVLVGSAAVAGLVSIDLLSTRWISTPVLTVLSWFTPDYMDLKVVEDGARMTSVFIYPNAFAACMGIGVLLALGLVVTSEKKGERAAHLVCLFINALAFILTFSMGACAMIVPAFLVLLALTGRDQRTSMLILMVETLAVTMLAAFPISLTSMTAWDGVRPIPLLCAAGGAAALCALDLLAGRRLAVKLAGYGKTVLLLAAAILAVLVIFIAAACNFTAGVTLQAGDSLRRSAYPAPGTYTLEAETDGDPLVVIQSQNRSDTMMHTSSELYRGALSQAAFTVPEDSLVVWFQFTARTETRLESAGFAGENGSGSVPLRYRLLPGFIANRLQGLRANQNAIQRFVFFEDGLKLFRRSPIFGLGLGAYANGVTSVQSFYYYTKYAHNHYIQTLVETGVVGLILFLGLLIVSAASIWRGRKHPLAPALGAALAFMAGHAMVEGIFSYFASLPFLFGVFASISLCCGDALPIPAWAEKKAARNGLALAACALLGVFGVLLGCNMAAQSMTASASSLEQLERAAALDPFEKADHMLTYVAWVTGTEADEDALRQADKYAARLEKIDSNTIPIYLAEYYLDTGRTEKGLEMTERYVAYVSSDSTVWQRAFDLLEEYEQDTAEYRAGVAHIVGLLDAWNEENMGHIVLNKQAQAFIDRILL